LQHATPQRKRTRAGYIAALDMAAAISKAKEKSFGSDRK
jgi:hypothetical protein